MGDIRQKQMGWRILIVGVGGQGALTIARMLCDFAAERGHEVVSGQLHGMARRAGSVQSSVMIDSGISPRMPRGSASCVLGLEPIETARALPFISSETTVLMNNTPILPYVLAQQFAREEDGAGSLDVAELIDAIRGVTPRVFALNATELAQSSGSIRNVNAVMLGCLFGSDLLPYTADDFLSSLDGKTPSSLIESITPAFLSGAERGRSLFSGEMTR